MSALIEFALEQGKNLGGGLFNQVVSITQFFTKKCLDLLQDNANMMKQLWANPDQLVTQNATGLLKQAAEMGLGGLAAFAEDYIKNNAEALVVGALEATGAMRTVEQIVEFVNNSIAAAIMFNNDLVFQMIKEVAHEGMDAIHKKDVILIQLAESLRAYYMALASLAGTSAEWNSYFDTLRSSLRYVMAARSDLLLVQNTLASPQGVWLSRRFSLAIKNLETAQKLMTPQEANPAIKMIADGAASLKKSYSLLPPSPDKQKEKEKREKEQAKRAKDLEKYGATVANVKATARDAQDPRRQTYAKQGAKQVGKGFSLFASGLASNFPFPTTAQQHEARLAIARLSSTILKQLNNYLSLTARVNGFVLAYTTAVTAISASLPDFLKGYVLTFLKRNYQRVDFLAKHMSLTLNGAEEATSPIMVTKKRYPGDEHPLYPGDPLGATPEPFRPSSLQITVQNYKWMMDLSVIFSAYRTIPIRQLNDLQLSADGVEAYKASVERLLSMDGMKTGNATLRMTNGMEEPGDLEAQILALVLEANNAVISSEVQKTVLPLCTTALTRLELGLYADNIIYNIFENFYNTPLPLQDSLTRMYDSLTYLIDKSGCDFLRDAIRTGDFKSLFNTKGKNARYIGRALTAFALLQKCMPGKFSAKWWSMKQLELDLKSQADLLNINFSINFNLAIFKNIQECLRLKGLIADFKPEEIICGLINAASKDMSKLGDKLKDVFSIGKEENTSALKSTKSLSGLV